MEKGVPLSHYRQHGADILLICGGCQHTQVLSLEDVIARLNTRGLDGEKVGIVELARFARQACPKCGRRKWSTRPAFPDIPGQTGVG